MTTPNIGLITLSNSQGQYLNANETFAILDALLGKVVKDKDLTAPPGAPADGDVYIVGPSATGLWDGHDNAITFWSEDAGEWVFITPREGWKFEPVDEDQVYRFDGTNWVAFTGGGMANPMTTAGDLIRGGTSGAPDRVAAGANGQVLTMVSGAPAWANNYVHPNHTGDVTSVGDGAQTIAADAVTNTKLANMATQTIKGRTTAGTGDPEDLTAAQVRTILNVANGATALPAVATFTGNKTLALSDINTYNQSQDGTAQTVTIPAQGTVAWTADAEIHIEQGGAGAVSITGATGVTVNGVSAGTVTLAGQRSVVTLKRTASNVWTVMGGLTNSLVTGPASSGDGNLVLFNGTTGKIIKDGGTVTAAGLALLDDTTAAAQRTTLGVGAGDSPTFTALTLSNGQIVFPATQVPSANANTLDDYEEGTWTPTLTFATPGDLSVAYTAREGNYTKIGRCTFLDVAIITSTFTHTTASGAISITGVPFPSNVAAVGSLRWAGVTKAGYTSLVTTISGGATSLSSVASGSGVGASSLAAADMPSGGTVQFIGEVTFR